jgi:hypothetical protein
VNEQISALLYYMLLNTLYNLQVSQQLVTMIVLSIDCRILSVLLHERAVNANTYVIEVPVVCVLTLELVGTLELVSLWYIRMNFENSYRPR